MPNLVNTGYAQQEKDVLIGVTNAHVAVQGAQDTARLARESTGEAVKVIKDRMHASLEEIRGSVSSDG